ncbi:hypothetical protein M8J76_006624 [Diaphorina citri]|nr:hypothetical protein M8J76_006624 [Diaphorina citri]
MPNIWRLFLIFCCSVLNVSVLATETASFYGASYISVPFQEAKSTTTISFKFRTKRSDAILFLSAGKIDYCLLRLESGRLKVHINLGAGDTEISTPRGLRLDDLLWHSVNVTRIESNVTLTVDLIHTTFEKLPGKFFELNIHYGLFIGGQGDFTELFLGHIEWLRGCLSDVIYNNIDTLKRARARSSQADAQGVLWACSAEFDASHDSEISFVDDGAFLSLPQVVQRAGVRLALDLKSDAPSGVLLYSSGPMSGGRADFLGLEIVNRRLRLLLDTGNGPFTLSSDVVIYIGGIELNKRARALSQGLKTADVSLKGCVRRLEVDSKPLGLGEAKVSAGLLAECVWSYPCLHAPPPCTSLTPCTQLGVASFTCDCSGNCVNPEYKNTEMNKSPLAVALEIIRLEPLTGENTLLSSAHISLVLDAARYGVRESGVMFHIYSPPTHGTLHLEIWEHDAHAGQMFTLLDLAKDKVRYIHDGSESRLDSFQCEVALSPGPGFLLPSYLQGRHRFRFHIQITPVNDPPTLTIPQTRVLRLAQGTRKTLSSDLLLASDLDSSPADLVFSVNQSESSMGHLERDHVTTLSFTQEELSQGRVQYVHTGNSTGNFKLALQVSDGMESSAVAYLNLAVHPLHLRPVNNTGAVLIHNSYTLITPANLSFSVNSDDTEVVIVYKVISGPQYGSLQTLNLVTTPPGGNSAKQHTNTLNQQQSHLSQQQSHSSQQQSGLSQHQSGSNQHQSGSNQQGDNWQSAVEFTDVQVRRSQVRYLHREGTPSEDEFKFTVSLRNAPLADPSVHAFPIRFVQLALVSSTNQSVAFHSHLRELLLTSAHASYQTTPLPVPPNTIVYKIVRPVVYGNLSRRGNTVGLSTGDMFTQAEINTGELYYSLHRTTYSNVTDILEFQVSAPHCQILSGRNLSFVYTPDASLLRKLTVTLNNLQVVEGGQERLSGSIVCHGVSSLSYRVTRPPRHGRLDLTEAVTSKKIIARDISRFSGAQLSRSLILYSHDDSESRSDRVEFVAVSSDKEDFQYIGSISISVALTNDNAPRRSSNHSVELVTGSSHLVLPSHLSYADEDTDATPHNIIYSVRSSEGGALYSAVKQTDRPLSEFSQADIDAGRVRYRHHRVLLVHASPPYVRVVNSSRLIVKEGGEAVLSGDHLNCETNVDMNPAQIKYDILEYPSYGELQFRAPKMLTKTSGGGTREGAGAGSGGGETPKRGDLSITSFSQRDVNAGSLVYVQNGILGPGHTIRRDVFKLRMDAGDRAWNESLVSVSIYPALYYTGLVRTKNETLLIEESTGFVITRQSLLIEQPGVPPSDIVYHAAINEERLHYVQAGGQNQTQDYFLLDVTNGILWIRGLQVNIIIVPEHIYLSSGDPVPVDEGGNITLLPSLLPLLSPYYANRVTEYRIIRQARHGAVYFSSNKVAIMRCTPQQLQAGLIQYIHDGSESSNDSFTLVARAGDKESNPATVHIVVLPVNDQVPRLVNNTGLVMYRGSTVPLSSENLACVDLDTVPDNLTYTILSAHHGHTALASSPGEPVYNFTQAQINAGTYRHHFEENKKGDTSDAADFEARVSDALHATAPFSFFASVRLPSLSLGRSSGLSVFPMLSKVITSADLVAWSSDREREVVYVVTQLPAHGFLHVADKAAYELPLNFTQADVNNSRVSYQHSSPFRDPDLRDVFRFNVLAEFTSPILNQSFPIHISVSYGGLEHLVTPRITLSVVEGGVAPIQLNTTAIVAFLADKVGLSSPTLSLSLLSEPSHGKVCECRGEHGRKSRRALAESKSSARESESALKETNLTVTDSKSVLESKCALKKSKPGLAAKRGDFENVAKNSSLDANAKVGNGSEWRRQSGADIEEKDTSGAEVEEKDKSGAEIEEKDESGAEIEEKDKSGAEIEEKDKSGAEIEEKDKSGAEVEEKDKSGVEIEEKDESGAEIEEKDKSGAEIEEKDKSQREDVNVNVSQREDVNVNFSQREDVNVNFSQREDVNVNFSQSVNVTSSSVRQDDRLVRNKRTSFDFEPDLGDPNGLLDSNPRNPYSERSNLAESHGNSRRTLENPRRNSENQLLNPENKTPGNQVTNPEIQLKTPENQVTNPEIQLRTPGNQVTNPENQVTNPKIQLITPGNQVKIAGSSVHSSPSGAALISEARNQQYVRQLQAYYGNQSLGQASPLPVEGGTYGQASPLPGEEGIYGQASPGEEGGKYGQGLFKSTALKGRTESDRLGGRIHPEYKPHGGALALAQLREGEEFPERGSRRGDADRGSPPRDYLDADDSFRPAEHEEATPLRGDADGVRAPGEFTKRGDGRGKALSPGRTPPTGNQSEARPTGNHSESECAAETSLVYFYDSVDLCYHHDHSDSVIDTLTVSIYLYPGDVLLTNISVDVAIEPINDQGFALRTAKPHVTVVQGHEVLITARDLYTEDNDTGPADIVYEIITQPTVGYIKIVEPAIQDEGARRGRSTERRAREDVEPAIQDEGARRGRSTESRAREDVQPAIQDEGARRGRSTEPRAREDVQPAIQDEGARRGRSTEPRAGEDLTVKEPLESDPNGEDQTKTSGDVIVRYQRDTNVMDDILVSRNTQNYASNFTQADINANRVLYVHNSNNTGQISFYFRVHDGKFSPVYNLFHINIVPIRLAIDITKPVRILQTNSLAVIPKSILSIHSNLNTYKHLRFLVTRPPLNGHIYVNEKKASGFTYPDLDAGNVLYMQTNMASYADLVQLEANILNLVRVERLYVNITVEPLINGTKFEPVSGVRNKLSTSVLNVDALAKVTNMNPVFRIIKKPKHGKLKKIIRSSGSGENLRESEISTFTYDQIRHGVVYYVTRKLNVSVTDCFVYLLNASVFQPAMGELCFPVSLQPTPPLNAPKSRINNNYNANIELSSPNISNDYALIVGMIAAVILLSVIIVFIVRLRSKRLVDRKKLYGEPPGGARVPVMKTSAHARDDLVMTSPVPVTYGAGKQRSANIKYPYGAVEQEEEESHLDAGPGVPPLRRNQYWV